MKLVRLGLARMLIGLAVVLAAAPGNAGFGTSVPISAELATNIAASMFPQTLDLGKGKLFLSDPSVIFVDLKRVAVQMRIQAYDHRPAEGVAESVEGTAVLSGEVGYDSVTRQVLLFRPQLDELVFNADSDYTKQVRDTIEREWQSKVTNPVRAEVPPHPYILPFKQGIQDISYGREGIVIQVWYE